VLAVPMLRYMDVFEDWSVVPVVAVADPREKYSLDASGPITGVEGEPGRA